ncbi:MAG: NAD(P)H-dependent oxidoreductase [Propionibacteriaceae bacterium]|nr:NAD(P)H-dependent oxidoreductase [Propionibacteriaceae bacterium]
MKIGIILGSIRDGRNGESFARWILDQAQGRSASYELVDLKEFDLPRVTSAVPAMMANKNYGDPAIQAWSDKIDSFDAYIFVTPEYNHSVPGAFKDAIDHLYPELFGKTVAVVSYGAGGGVRATEAWRLVLANFDMRVVRASVAADIFTDFADAQYQPIERHRNEIVAVFDAIESRA